MVAQVLKLSFKVMLGYNNGVGILNIIGKICYSNEKYGAVGRSFNLDDVEKVFYNDFESLREEYKGSNKRYPFVHALEEYSNVTGRYLSPGSSLGRRGNCMEKK